MKHFPVWLTADKDMPTISTPAYRPAYSKEHFCLISHFRPFQIAFWGAEGGEKLRFLLDQLWLWCYHRIFIFTCTHFICVICFGKWWDVTPVQHNTRLVHQQHDAVMKHHFRGSLLPMIDDCSGAWQWVVHYWKRKAAGRLLRCTQCMLTHKQQLPVENLHSRQTVWKPLQSLQTCVCIAGRQGWWEQLPGLRLAHHIDSWCRYLSESVGGGCSQAVMEGRRGRQ